MLKKCLKCNFSIKTCSCNDIKPIETNIKFVILIHRREAYKQKLGTGRITHLFLKDSELIKGINFTENNRVNELINDGEYFPVLLYPGDDSFFVEDKCLDDEVKSKKLLIFILDGTWWDSKVILRESLNLQKIPKMSFKGEYVSKFYFKKQPFKYCLSTIESVYYLLKSLKIKNKIYQENDYEILMGYFNKMVQRQTKYWNRGDKNKIYLEK